MLLQGEKGIQSNQQDPPTRSLLCLRNLVWGLSWQVQWLKSVLPLQEAWGSILVGGTKTPEAQPEGEKKKKSKQSTQDY